MDGDLDERAIWNANAPAWIELSRAGRDVYRDVVNTPAFLAMLPDVDGLRCLDLGCGEGHNTRVLAGRGAGVVALDVSEVLLAAARAADDGCGIRYVHGDGSSLPFASASFDVVTAFMSLMDTAEPERVLGEVARVLRPDGFLQCSVTHPLIATPEHRWLTDDDGKRAALAVGDYFHEGPVPMRWIFGTASERERARHRPFEIVHARRTLSSWLNAIIVAGFTIEEVGEPRADEQQAADHPSVADTLVVPYFLLVRARRSAPAIEAAGSSPTE